MDDPGAHFTRQLDDDQLDAMVEAVYLAAISDGEFSDIERTRFAESVKLLTDGRVDDARVALVQERVAGALRDSSRTRCVESIARRLDSEPLRHVAFVLALDMVAADAVMRPEERQFLEELADGLGLARDETGILMSDIPALAAD